MNVLAQASCMTYFAKRIEDIIEEDQDFPFCDFGYIVHALARVVPDPGILICKAC